VREDAGVVKKLLLVNGGVGHVLQADHKELQRLPMIAREQFAQMLHHASC